MTRKTFAGGPTARTTKGIGTLNSVFQTVTVQAEPEPATLTLADDADAVAAAADRLERVREIVFADEPAFRPALAGYFAGGGTEYAAEGRGSASEWLVVEDLATGLELTEVRR